MEIVEAKTFANEEGNKVTAFLPIDPETYEIKLSEDVAFNGEIMVGTNMGPMSFSFEFPEGFTLEKCFENFEQIAEEAFEEKKQEMMDQNRIVTPDQMKSGDNPIIMP